MIKKAIKTTEQRCSGVFHINLQHISHLVLAFIVKFEQLSAGWVINHKKMTCIWGSIIIIKRFSGRFISHLERQRRCKSYRR